MLIQPGQHGCLSGLSRTAGLSVEIFETTSSTTSQTLTCTLSHTVRFFFFFFLITDFLLVRSNGDTRASFVEGLIPVGEPATGCFYEEVISSE